MTTIFYSRENINQSKFIFDTIIENERENDGIYQKTLIIAPEQFTFQIERDAFHYMGKTSIAGLDIMGFQRLGAQVLRHTGGNIQKIGISGRKMLVSKIIKENKDNLTAFKDMTENSDFIDVLCDSISDLKSQNANIENLENVFSKLENKDTLKGKLRDLSEIYRIYEKYMENRYLDGEDYIDLYNKKIPEANFLKRCSIWVYGFDLFDEKRLETLIALEKIGLSLNIVLTFDNSEDEDLFNLGRDNIRILENILEVEKIVKIDEKYKIPQSKGIEAIERSLYKLPIVSESENTGVTLFQCANQYNEAINAASFVMKLVREKGYKFKDIIVINNEIDQLGELYKRVFKDYGISVFLDESKSIYQNQIMLYLKNIVLGIKSGFDAEKIMEVLNTVFFAKNEDIINELEIYARNYAFDKKHWENPFEKGKNKYSEDDLEEFNLIRERIVLPLIKLKDEVEKSQTVREKIQALWEFLENKVNIREKIEALWIFKDEDKRDVDDLEGAQENAQIWNKAVDVFGQMIEILGSDSIKTDEFCDILILGLETIEIGVIPPATDCLIIGDMKRTKKGISKATIVVNGGNGIIPKNSKGEGLFTSGEIEYLKDIGVNISSPIEKISMEEKVNIYRNMAKTMEELYISYSISSQDGEKIEPSEIIETVRDILPNLSMEKDWISQNKIENVLGGREITKSILLNGVIGILDNSISAENRKIMRELYKWYRQRDEDIIEVIDHIFKNDKIEKIPPQIIKRLYFNTTKEDKCSIEEDNREKSNLDLILSPSRLELFGKCPFAHFISYGIKPEIEKKYKVESSDLGSIYHECMKKFIETAFKKNGENTLKIDKKNELIPLIQGILEDIYKDYNEGILASGKEEEYRKERIKEVCIDSAYEALRQLQKDQIDEILCEVNFGKRQTIPPLEVENYSNGGDNNHRIFVGGQIDRLDVGKNGEIKVIDYKSGNDTFDLDESMAGVKLQLFLYLMAASNLKIDEGKKSEPIGAFYFNVKENMTDEGKKSSGYKLDGFIKKINEDEEIDKEIYKIRRGNSNVYSQEEFTKIIEIMGEKISKMANEINDGNIKIYPKKIGTMESCQFCGYKGICKFDLSIEDCNYNVIK